MGYEVLASWASCIGFAVATAALACATPDAELACDDFAEPASLELGRADERGFIAVDADVELELECTLSGFYVVWLAMRAHGILPGTDGRFGHPADPLVSLTVSSAEQELGTLAGGAVNLGFALRDGAAEFLELYVLVDERRCNDYVDDLDGVAVTVRGSVEDACGHSATDELAAVLVNAQPLSRP